MTSDRPSVPERADVVVVGGGVMGTATAYFLASESDLEVTLLEKDQLAAGSSGDSSAIVRHHYGDQAIYSRLAWWSNRFYREFEARTGEPIAYEGNPFVRFASADDEYVLAGYDVLESLDVPVSKVEGDAISERYPMFPGIDRFDLAVSDDAAAYSDGSDVASGFGRAAAGAGATVVTGVEVTGLRTAEGAITGVETDAGTVDCESVVVAAGPWTPRLLESVGVDVPVTPMREEILILDPPPEYDQYLDATPTTGLPGGEWYIRPDFGEGILVGTHRLAEPCDPDSYDRDVGQDTLLDLVDRLADLVPSLADAGVQGSYAGVYSVTPDHDFVIDRAGPDGCYVAAGFSGHGFKHAPAVGKMLADLVTGGETDLADLSFFSLDRFEAHPEGHGAPEDNI